MNLHSSFHEGTMNYQMIVQMSQAYFILVSHCYDQMLTGSYYAYGIIYNRYVSFYLFKIILDGCVISLQNFLHFLTTHVHRVGYKETKLHLFDGFVYIQYMHCRFDSEMN